MTEREALELALEAMTYADACLKKQLTTKDKHQYAQTLLLEAGTAIREALRWTDETAKVPDHVWAQPEQEPVAWGMMNDDGKIYDCICPEEHDRLEGEYTVPLYTTPPQEQRCYCGNIYRLGVVHREDSFCDEHPRKPLTVDEVWQNDQLMSLNAQMGCSMDLLMEVVEAIEAAHGIEE